MQNLQADSIKELRKIPGIGVSLAKDLYLLGFRRVVDLQKADPEIMYAKLCEVIKSKQDPCVLYAFRCAVYFAREKNPDSKLLKWWNWKDRKLQLL